MILEGGVQGAIAVLQEILKVCEARCRQEILKCVVGRGKDCVAQGGVVQRSCTAHAGNISLESP